uniref:TldD protein n=1 Tax=Candidatus Kentrum sp. TUN TaxID=2126343 RepID=A0A451APF5_9GAMM|nr:MAG: microcin-processing peptidase 2. Unknown type peptidase. MEROPS family U62 [Candidatus Kentron sp. TUN]VFK59364.1 MAG: microcin-processing peptidase 2. Unknown type peptidase. MEROPS family U62 [Candidatus Kentron sp. TUN]VFK67941.1 MAG: microcin-processing peptidase 2. Unknown type peptidase. MEROPS family U62 [Candidatus Kentron sp. TUN]
MTNTLELAKNLILDPAGLGEHEIQLTLDRLLGHSIDTADIYFESTRSESWALEDSIVKNAAYGIEQGAGVRAISGEKTGFAYSDEISLPALTSAATAARAIAGHGGNGKLQAWHRTEGQMLYQPDDPLLSLTEQDRVALLKTIDAEARRQDPRVTQVIVGLAGEFSTMLVAGSDGTFAGDIRPLVRLSVHVIVEQDGKREQGSAGGGGRHDYGIFRDQERGLAFAREAVRQALVNLEAVHAPAGTMTVVLGPGWPGILLHEAIGHGLEGDFNRKGSSVFAGRIGERVATEHCTVVDDGTLPGRRGSLNVDDEGTPTRCTTLIEKGILTGYLQDKLNARLMGTQSTGNGRRESYSYLPMPRMTNTYLLAGEHDPQEIIGSVENGLYAAHFGGGQVDITSGKFVFSASEAYLIEKGKLTRPVKGATLIGSGPDVLTKVAMLGNDLALDEGVGVCGKEGQSVPVGVGQPTLRVDGLTVGGTEVGA